MCSKLEDVRTYVYIRVDTMHCKYISDFFLAINLITIGVFDFADMDTYKNL